MTGKKENQKEDGLLAEQINKLIHEPARLLIMANLFVIQKEDCIYLMRQTSLSMSNLSAHLTKLERAEFV
ncbi:MAG: ArsR family transcriptional regulator [Anaerolineaceae bacterium]|nr:ArsR family transcriptional regulator [Anaerolineaceae bacterium]